jgi:hypothetical protein
MGARIVDVRSLGEFRLEITFADGLRGEVDLTGVIKGQDGVFLPLQDPQYFEQVYVNPELGTIAWPNDVDLDPDVLYSRVSGRPIALPDSA